MTTTQDTPNAITIQPGVTKITAEMVKEANEKYKEELAAKRTSYEDVKTAYSSYGDDEEDFATIHEINRRINQATLAMRSAEFTPTKVKENLPFGHLLGQDLVTNGEDTMLVCKDSHAHRFFIDVEDNNFVFYYNNKPICKGKQATAHCVAGILTQLLNVCLINNIENTVAIEEGDSIPLSHISLAITNLLDGLDLPNGENPDPVIKECMNVNKLSKVNTSDYLLIPKSYLPAGIIEDIEDNVYASCTFPGEEGDPQDTEIVDHVTFDKEEPEGTSRRFNPTYNIYDMEKPYWNPHSNILLNDSDYIYWRNTSEVALENLPTTPYDFVLPLDVLARCTSDALMYELEPYIGDLDKSVNDVITPSALYIMLTSNEKLGYYGYTPVFRLGETYTEYRHYFGKLILDAIGVHIKNDDSWEDAAAIDTLEVIEVAIDKAMYAGTLEELGI